jgi:hypothetical protein
MAGRTQGNNELRLIPKPNQTVRIACSNGNVKACRNNALIALWTALTTKGGTSKTSDFLHVGKQ